MGNDHCESLGTKDMQDYERRRACEHLVIQAFKKTDKFAGAVEQMMKLAEENQQKMVEHLNKEFA